jgi:hypothetical protein
VSEGWARFWVGLVISIVCMFILAAMTTWPPIGVIAMGLLMGYCLSIVDIIIIFICCLGD